MADLLDTSHHDRRVQQRLRESPEFRAEFERQQRELSAIDAERNLTTAPAARRDCC
jgi:hypothetical protein